MKKVFNFVLSIALLGNILCSTVALAETDPKIEKQITTSSYLLIENTVDPDTDSGD